MAEIASQPTSKKSYVSWQITNASASKVRKQQKKPSAYHLQAPLTLKSLRMALNPSICLKKQISDGKCKHASSLRLGMIEISLIGVTLIHLMLASIRLFSDGYGSNRLNNRFQKSISILVVKDRAFRKSSR